VQKLGAPCNRRFCGQEIPSTNKSQETDDFDEFFARADAPPWRAGYGPSPAPETDDPIGSFPEIGSGRSADDLLAGHANAAVAPLTMKIVPAPVIDRSAEVFIGAGDGSAGSWSWPCSQPRQRYRIVPNLRIC
jgi:hypothetical protein